MYVFLYFIWVCFEDYFSMMQIAACMSVAMIDIFEHSSGNMVIPEGITVCMWLTCVTKLGRVSVDCIVLSYAFVCHASF